MATNDSSIEFDIYEEIRRKLSEFLTEQGRSMIDAERIALYTVQGIRAVPKLMSILSQNDAPRRDQTYDVLRTVLDGGVPLSKARAILMNETSMLDD